MGMSHSKLTPIEQHEVIIEALKSRRSIGRVKKDEVPKETIEQIIEAATWAPSHHNTQPWRFVVMTGEGRRLLGEGYAAVQRAQSGELSEEEFEKHVQKAFRSPVVIAAICSPSDDKRAVREEELAAAQAAVQNLLIAAYALGLGAIWRSGAPMYHPAMNEQFKLREDEEIVGLVYLGIPDMTPPLPARKAVQEVTEWVEA